MPSTVEAFVVCQGFNPPPGFKSDLSQPLLGFSYDSRAGQAQNPLFQMPELKYIAPFVACGDLRLVIL